MAATRLVLPLGESPPPKVPFVRSAPEPLTRLGRFGPCCACLAPHARRWPRVPLRTVDEHCPRERWLG